MNSVLCSHSRAAIDSALPGTLEERFIAAPRSDMAQSSVDSAEIYTNVVLGGKPYAIADERICDVIPLPYLTRIPNLPGYVKGLCSFRERLIPVVDLRTKYGLPDALTDDTRVVVIQTELAPGRERQMGLIFDRVGGAVAFSSNQFAALSLGGSTRPADYLLGLVPTSNGVRLLLEVNLAVTAELMELMRSN